MVADQIPFFVDVKDLFFTAKGCFVLFYFSSDDVVNAGGDAAFIEQKVIFSEYNAFHLFPNIFSFFRTEAFEEEITFKIELFIEILQEKVGVHLFDQNSGFGTLNIINESYKCNICYSKKGKRLRGKWVNGC